MAIPDGLEVAGRHVHGDHLKLRAALLPELPEQLAERVRALARANPRPPAASPVGAHGDVRESFEPILGAQPCDDASDDAADRPHAIRRIFETTRR